MIIRPRADCRYEHKFKFDSSHYGVSGPGNDLWLAVCPAPLCVFIHDVWFLPRLKSLSPGWRQRHTGNLTSSVSTHGPREPHIFCINTRAQGTSHFVYQHTGSTSHFVSTQASSSSEFSHLRPGWGPGPGLCPTFPFSRQAWAGAEPGMLRVSRARCNVDWWLSQSSRPSSGGVNQVPRNK